MAKVDGVECRDEPFVGQVFAVERALRQRVRGATAAAAARELQPEAARLPAGGARGQSPGSRGCRRYHEEQHRVESGERNAEEVAGQ